MRHALAGTITSAGFRSGDRMVVGDWRSSPIGPFCDVMWAAPDGVRTLLASSAAALELITAVYDFDAAWVAGVVVADEAGGSIAVRAEPLALRLRPGPGWRLPGGRRRPAWWHRFVEGPVAKVVLGVEVYGTSPSGVREWYRADAWRPLAGGSATLSGRDLGPLAPLRPPCRFGFSEPPVRPSSVAVRPLLEDPSGRLDAVITRWAEDPATSATPSDRSEG